MATSSVTTRQKNEIFLIGLRDLEPLLRLNQLPTSKQVLQRFHYYLNETKSVRSSSNLTIEEVMKLWSKAAIPTTLKRNAIEKLEKVHSFWLLLKKNKNRSTVIQQERQLKFTNQLDNDILFDIGHADALNIIKIEQDRCFLVDQRGDRKMFMTTEDKELAKKQERARLRQSKEEERRLKYAVNAYTSATFDSVDICQTGNSESLESSHDSDGVFEPTRKSPCPPKKDSSTSACQLFNKHVTSALDRNKTSDREAVRILIPIAAAIGCDPSALPISRSTIHRMRKKARKEYTKSVRKHFDPQYPLVVHWDGKILPEIVGEGKVDRLPVLVSGDGMDKLLGVPKLAAGTAQNEVKAVYDLLVQWKVTDKIQAMSFDTTAVNTGKINGVCVSLEKMIGRELLWLACRHHVLEIILAKTFTLCCGPSSSPDIPIFKRFKIAWQEVSCDDFQQLEFTQGTEEFIESTLLFLKKTLERGSQIRDDYQELIELTMIALGNVPARIHWRAPGPVHHARWMAKVIYAIKILLFRNQRDVFNLTKREETQLQRFAQFGVLLYTSSWTAAHLPPEAPAQDLKLWLDLTKYKTIDREVGDAATKILENHLWYLSDETVGLALFSDNVSAEEKLKIVHGMCVEPSERRVRGNPNILNERVCLGDFATKRTAKLLHRLMIQDSFLALAPEKWSENEHYVQGMERIKKLRVVNDTAERGVKLFEEFNKLITNDEEEKQFLLQVVEANRKSIPTQTTKKSAIDAIKI